MSDPASSPSAPPPDGDEPLGRRIRRFLVGSPRDLHDRSLFHRLSLIPFLAWVGLGADGLSSSSYGPEEAYLALGRHSYIAVGIAFMMIVTVVLISMAYSRIIERFPHGGGGYVVATKLLGRPAGVVSGSALLVDYILTITTSIAAAGDAIFSLMPPEWQTIKLPVEVVFIVGLTTLNIRGVRESVLALAPIFILFLVTHVILLGGVFLTKGQNLPHVVEEVSSGFRDGLGTLGAGGMFMLFVHAYSLGGGTYTGLEAVSNGLPIMREPRVHTAQRTMLYMASSLAITAGGLLLCYLLVGVTAESGKTLNAVLAERFAGGDALGRTFVIVTLISEGALLVVAAQAGFLDGPRVLANMAVDSWVPRSFANLSDRLTTQNGIVLMGAASLGALIYTGGEVKQLVIMYSINVFVTFSLSMFGMLKYWLTHREARWARRAFLFLVAFVLCATILVFTVYEKFTEGGWLTLVVTLGLVGLCFLIRTHYKNTLAYLGMLDAILKDIPASTSGPTPAIDKTKPTAAVLVANFGGLGVHTVLNIFRNFPGHYKNLVFLSVAVIDSDVFKGEQDLHHLEDSSHDALAKYVDFAARLGVPATSRLAVGTDPVEEAAKLCVELSKDFPRLTVFAGQVMFQEERWYQRFLHNQMAFATQKKLQWKGLTMVILPAKIT